MSCDSLNSQKYSVKFYASPESQSLDNRFCVCKLKKSYTPHVLFVSHCCMPMYHHVDLYRSSISIFLEFFFHIFFYIILINHFFCIYNSLQDGKSSSAVLVCAFFVFCKLFKKPEDALQLFALQRCCVNMVPSQVRYERFSLLHCPLTVLCSKQFYKYRNNCENPT